MGLNDGKEDHVNYELGSAVWIAGFMALFMLMAIFTSRQEHPGVAPDRPVSAQLTR